MAFDLSALKKISSGSSSEISRSDSSNYRTTDPDLWKPTIDKNGNGLAVIRLLPSIEEGKLPWIKTEKYFIEGPHGWYVNNSLRMKGQADPMAEYINELWNKAKANNDEVLKETLRKKYRVQTRYACVAKVIDDPADPTNNGRVVIYEFNKTIYDKIMEKMKPVFQGDRSINVFDWIDGCNLRIKIYKNGMPRYDRCEFDSPSPIPDNEIVDIAEKIQKINLNKYMAPDQFKTYDELKARLNEVFGLSAGVGDVNFGSAPSSEPNSDFVNGNTKNAFGTVEEKTPIVESKSDVAPWESDNSGELNIDDIEFDKMMG